MDQMEFSEGGEEALAAAIRQYGQGLLRYCHHILCDYHEAQDAVQITFCKAWERRTRCRTGALPAWLYRMAYTTCVDILRQRKRWRPLPPAPEGTDYIGPELRTALEALSPEERGLVFGRVMEGRSYEELSGIYGKSAATLRKRYERARKKLARLLTQEQAEERKAT